MTPGRTAELASAVYRTYRAAGIARRSRYELERRSGVLRRRTPIGRPWPEPWGDSVPALFDVDRIREGYRQLTGYTGVRRAIVTDADRVLAGELRFFGGPWRRVGWPPRWLVQPETGHVHRSDVHWTTVSHADAAEGDIKDVWEPSRFTFATLLTRAHTVTGDPRYAEAFWGALQDWVSHNPVNAGPNWSCGQEASVRAANVLFAASALSGSETATPERQRLVRRLLRATGQRVDATLHYALSQRNNHAISETACLLVLAALFPEWPEAARWRRRGLYHLRACVRDQFYEDGGYAQHSVTYHRFALQTMSWTTSVMRSVRASVPGDVIEATRRSVTLLTALQDRVTGHLPNLGANDGSLLLALSTCPYRDFRPTLQAAAAAVGQTPTHPAGTWDEERLWLSPVPPPSSNDAQPVVRRPWYVHAGLAVSRDADSLVVLRGSPSRRHRPSHADAMHVDVWLDGHEVAADPGTYRYTGHPPWDNGLARAACHNRVVVRGMPDRRVGRFFWMSWPRTTSRFDVVRAGVRICDLEIELGPSSEPIRHRRLVAHSPHAVVIVDEARAESAQSLRLHWNFPARGTTHTAGDTWTCDGPGWWAAVAAEQRAHISEVVRASDDVLGWRSPTYTTREAARSVLVDVDTSRTTWLTVISPLRLPGELTDHRLLLDQAVRGSDGELIDAMLWVSRRFEAGRPWAPPAARPSRSPSLERVASRDRERSPGQRSDALIERPLSSG